MITIPLDLARTIRSTFGAAGAAWLETAPQRIAAAARNWRVQLLPPFNNLSYNYVTPVAMSDGRPAVLKMGVPNKELRTEMAALTAFDGRGAVRVLSLDPARGAMLLQRVRPGTPLSELENDAAATRVAASLLHELWRPAQDADLFPSTEDWARGFERLRRRYKGGTSPLPRDLTARAEAIYAEHHADSAAWVLLHGDLHHGNILRAGREAEHGHWLAIDPKGVLGEPAYDAAVFLRSLPDVDLTESGVVKQLRRRAVILSEQLELDRQRLLRWSFAQAMLSAYWCVEDGAGDVERTIRIAELLREAET